MGIPSQTRPRRVVAMQGLTCFRTKMQFAGTIKFASAVLEGENEKYHETGPQTNHTTSYDRNNLLPSKEQRFPVFGCLFTVRATVGGWVSLFRDFVHEIRKKNCESPQLLRDGQSGRDLTFSLLRSPQTVSGNADETAKTILQTPSKLRKKTQKL